MSKYLKLFLKIAGILAVVGVIALIGIQFIPVERTNPPIVSQPKWDSPETKALAERACFDCHSNETKWPWYSIVAPVSWLVSKDVVEGRAKLNFSEWGVQKGEASEEGEGGEPDEIAEQVEKGDMPLPYYLITHPEARLTSAETKALIAGLNATFGAASAGAMNK
jgi:hypothetical protein